MTSSTRHCQGGLRQRKARNAHTFFVRRLRENITNVAAISVIATLLLTGKCLAQDARYRLTVRPHQMATGTQNPKAGEYPLGSVPDYLVYVPKQCVGARRCPLFTFLPGAGYGARTVVDWLHLTADKYGMILLAPTDYETPILDAALKEVLANYAIDPDKLAVIGRCASGGAGSALGSNNLDVFSRIALISGGEFSGQTVLSMYPSDQKAKFLASRGALVSVGVGEIGNAGYGPNYDRNTAQQAGLFAKYVLGLRDHAHQLEDYDFLGHWLDESWATPDPAARPAPQILADPLPLLTPRILRQMSLFWDAFMSRPDWLSITARREHLREVLLNVNLPAGDPQPSSWMVDMSALAAEYPAVAEALQRAKLTAAEHDAYRVAILSAILTTPSPPIDSNSVRAKNVALLKAQPDLVQRLEAQGIWRTP